MSETPIKVLHLASHEINVGDGALNDAIRAGVRRVAKRPVAFELMDVAVQRPQLNAEMVDAYDIVIVGGGGGISNGRFAADTGTPMPISFEEYRKSKVPFAFVGLGHNVFEGDPFRHGEALKRLLAEAARRGDPFSVRNDGSLVRLKRDLGEAASSIIEIPDPGFFVDARPQRPLEVSIRPYILLQPAADSLDLRLKTSRLQKAFRRFLGREQGSAIIREIVQFGISIWRRHKMDILVAPHIPADIGMAAAIVKGLYAEAGPEASYRPFRLGGTPHPTHSSEFFAAYKNAELVVGMRGHSVICGVGLRKPTIAISTHPKVIGFMDACGLEKWTVQLSDQMAGNLVELSDGILENVGRDYLAQRDSHVGDFEHRFEAFLELAMRRVSSEK